MAAAAASAAAGGPRGRGRGKAPMPTVDDPVSFDLDRETEVLAWLRDEAKLAARDSSYTTGAGTEAPPRRLQRVYHHWMHERARAWERRREYSTLCHIHDRLHDHETFTHFLHCKMRFSLLWLDKAMLRYAGAPENVPQAAFDLVLEFMHQEGSFSNVALSNHFPPGVDALIKAYAEEEGRKVPWPVIFFLQRYLGARFLRAQPEADSVATPGYTYRGASSFLVTDDFKGDVRYFVEHQGLMQTELLLTPESNNSHLWTTSFHPALCGVKPDYGYLIMAHPSPGKWHCLLGHYSENGGRAMAPQPGETVWECAFRRERHVLKTLLTLMKERCRLLLLGTVTGDRNWPNEPERAEFSPFESHLLLRLTPYLSPKLALGGPMRRRSKRLREPGASAAADPSSDEEAADGEGSEGRLQPNADDLHAIFGHLRLWQSN